MGKKWYFLAFSLVFSVAGICSMLFWHDIPLGVEFRGGTLVYVKFAHTPDLDQHPRAPWTAPACTNAKIQRYGPPSNNEVLIDLDVQETSEQALDKGKNTIIHALETARSRGQDGPEQHQRGHQELSDGEGPDAPGHRRRAEIHPAMAQAIEDFRNKEHGGILTSVDELRGDRAG